MSSDAGLELTRQTKESSSALSVGESSLVSRGLRAVQESENWRASFASGNDERLARLRANLPSIRERASGGDADSQYDLGDIFYWGEVVTKDCATAAQWYARAADQSHLYAHMDLARMYESGEGVPVDPTQAALHRLKAADIAVAEFEGEYSNNWDPDSITAALEGGAKHGHVLAALWFIRLALHYERTKFSFPSMTTRARDLMKQYGWSEADFVQSDQ